MTVTLKETPTNYSEQAFLVGYSETATESRVNALKTVINYGICNQLEVHHLNGSPTDRSDALRKDQTFFTLGPTSNTKHLSAAHLLPLIAPTSWVILATSTAEANFSLVNTSSKACSLFAYLAMNLRNSYSLWSPRNSWITIFPTVDFRHWIGWASRQNLPWYLPVGSPSIVDCKISEEFRHILIMHQAFWCQQSIMWLPMTNGMNACTSPQCAEYQCLECIWGS